MLSNSRMKDATSHESVPHPKLQLKWPRVPSNPKHPRSHQQPGGDLKQGPLKLPPLMT